MSAAQPGLRALHDGPRSVAPCSCGSIPAPTSGDGSRPRFPPHPGESRRHPRRTSEDAPAALSGPRLAGADLYDWMALRRVRGGGIAKMSGRWLEHGYRIPDYVADALTALCDAGVVALAEVDEWGLRRAALTGTGTDRYHQLGGRQPSPDPRSGRHHKEGC